MRFLKPNLIALIIALVVSFPIYTGNEGEVGAFDGEIVRLHILANSDSKEDQLLKLKVRDEILKFADSGIMEETDKRSLDEAVKANKRDFLKIALETVRKNGYDYGVTAVTGVFDFPARRYGDSYFPKGRYSALKIIIGSGNGHNWWCVMYPPLCFTDKSDGELTKDKRKSLSENTEDIITKPKYKFKAAELFGG